MRPLIFSSSAIWGSQAPGNTTDAPGPMFVVFWLTAMGRVAISYGRCIRMGE